MSFKKHSASEYEGKKFVWPKIDIPKEEPYILLKTDPGSGLPIRVDAVRIPDGHIERYNRVCSIRDQWVFVPAAAESIPPCLAAVGADSSVENPCNLNTNMRCANTIIGEYLTEKRPGEKPMKIEKHPYHKEFITTCESCMGSGIKKDSEDLSDCPKCNGRGKRDLF